MNEPKDDPKPVIPYETLSTETRRKRRAFGSVGGNVAMGFALFVLSCIVSVKLAITFNVREAWAYLAGPVVTLGLFTVAACFARYRGLLSGAIVAILAAGFIVLGVIMLIASICGSIGKGL